MTTKTEFDLSNPHGRFKFLQQKAKRFYARQLGDECYDLAVVTWVRCEAKLGQVRTSVAAWLCTSLRRQFLNSLRRRKPLLPGSPALVKVVEDDLTASNSVYEAIDDVIDGKCLVEEFLSVLPAKQSEALRMEVDEIDEPCTKQQRANRTSALGEARRKLSVLPAIIRLAQIYNWPMDSRG